MTLHIQNLKCGGCEATIISKLSRFKKVSKVSVNQELDAVNFEYDDQNELELVIQELSRLGYPPIGEKNPLSKKAKSYVSCAMGRMKN